MASLVDDPAGLDMRELERATIAAYNAGEGRVLKCVRKGQDVDTFTAHGNYAKQVLEYAEAYRGLEA